VSIQAERLDGRWVTSPETMAPEAAAAMVSRLAELTAIDVVAEALGPEEQAALGLAPARVAVRVWGEGASAPLLADVALGRVRAGIGVYARRADADEILLLEAEVGAEIPTSLTAFRDEFGERSVADEDAAGIAGDADRPPDAVEGVIEPEL
jgi:hypothetical protein